MATLWLLSSAGHVLAPPFIDEEDTLWDNPTMSTAKVDSKKRILLPNGQPGDVYDVQQQPDGRVLLVRLERPEDTPSLSKEACLEAMERAPLRPSMAWEDLRSLTREP